MKRTLCDICGAPATITFAMFDPDSGVIRCSNGPDIYTGYSTQKDLCAECAEVITDFVSERIERVKRIQEEK